jgi:hypothetical protein
MLKFRLLVESQRKQHSITLWSNGTGQKSSQLVIQYMEICVFDTRGTLDFYIASVRCFGGVEHLFAPPNKTTRCQVDSP